ncbi:DUF1295 domain-containing protein [Halalkalibacter urbisdiaboli]|uniref:DUF1295 domain-containing protein n=1 Tax=Halalkalibacter urbisdiaboli TaxID=1960589 RepID=UPI000B432E46|nr:DUF1295 domain-containing protein [Halalkalibacter urbisdiaboli]
MVSIYNRNTGYWLPRFTLIALETIVLCLSGWLLLFKGTETLNELLYWSLPSGNQERNILLFILIVLVYLRMFATIFIFLRRAMPWVEVFTIPLAFSLYYVGFPLLSLPTNRALDGWDLLFIAIFVVGSFLNTVSEWLRAHWKRKPENRGQVYTGGLFRYSAHINYFGDLLWVLALALLTWNPWSFVIPIFLFCFFAFYNIPMLDRHLENKYGEEFRAYQNKTKKFIPFLY